jgi:hypothetical protein
MIIFLAQKSPEGGYEARALDHDIFTQAKNVEELRTIVREAVRRRFDSLL